MEDVLEADVPLADGERPAPRVHHARHPATSAAAARWRGGAGGGVGAAEAEEAADVAVH